MEFKVEGYDYLFRIKKMSAIETLAMKSQVKLNTFENASKLFSTVLEYLEVNFENNWFSVKEKNSEIYFPSEVETNVDLVEKLIKYFIDEFLSPIFMKSSESNQ